MKKHKNIPNLYFENQKSASQSHGFRGPENLFLNNLCQQLANFTVIAMSVLVWFGFLHPFCNTTIDVMLYILNFVLFFLLVPETLTREIMVYARQLFRHYKMKMWNVFL